MSAEPCTECGYGGEHHPACDTAGCPSSPGGNEPHLTTDDRTCDECGADLT
ncbi:hypothetical protein RHODO2019_10800 [Rhodococcus antarcticus]|uniref:Uncharacterized protein n=1 Tax=Rhodococcus antarcticus TaxID=2987751 RepID=A0ABY6NXE5_9NOCA|nr:hypothetical protein [Rhodococcus antarcticus]UZJ23696.1 hypothetical protein RHODO2019_10800 [Rhodococcus antarcticus]